MFSLLSRPLIGLDIQPYGLKCVQLRKSLKGKFLIEQAVFRRLPANIFADGKIREWGIVQSMLEDIVRELRWKGKGAAIQLPANLVRTQKMQIPYGMRDEDILEEIKCRVERDVREEGKTLSIDFHVEEGKEKKFSQVHFAVTRQEYVKQYVDCIDSAGLKVKMVDVDLYALKRLFAFTNIESEIQGIFCEMNDYAMLVISDRHEILFHHQWKATREIVSEIENRITTFSAMFPEKKIKKLLVYSESQIQLDNVEIEYPNPFSIITFKQDIQSESLPDFLLACGLAMCELHKC